MSRLATSFVLGYHGCDKDVAERLISRKDSIQKSNQDFDWLGPGAYFWEGDPHRALEWAEQQVSRGRYESAAVIGAVIDLGNCLDLSNRENVKVFKGAHSEFITHQQTAGLPVPENGNAPGDPHGDRMLRRLDCAVFQHLHKGIDEAITRGSPLERFDSVRGMFTEGGRLYENCGFFERTHIQIAVCNTASIVGLFKPLRL